MIMITIIIITMTITFVQSGLVLFIIGIDVSPLRFCSKQIEKPALRPVLLAVPAGPASRNTSCGRNGSPANFTDLVSREDFRRVLPYVGVAAILIM